MEPERRMPSDMSAAAGGACAQEHRPVVLWVCKRPALRGQVRHPSLFCPCFALRSKPAGSNAPETPSSVPCKPKVCPSLSLPRQPTVCIHPDRVPDRLARLAALEGAQEDEAAGREHLNQIRAVQLGGTVVAVGTGGWVVCVGGRARGERGREERARRARRETPSKRLPIHCRQRLQ